MDLTGQTFGKYKLIRRLGKGGMAQVYEAIQPTIERQVAVKILHTHLSESEDFVLRFKREARSLGQLQHPGIVNIIDFDVQDEIYYMVMDYIPGQTLRDYLDKQGTLSNGEALSLLSQLVEALSYAHQQGAVHRDIKPGNIMFADESNSRPVLTDFGITKMVDDHTLTQTGSMVGTPAYMSPEAVMGEGVDARADIYSLGVVLYEMVTGRTPYEGNTPLSVVVKQMHEPLPTPLNFRPDLPLPIVDLIEKSLAKELSERYQTAEAFLAAIQAVQQQLNLPVIGRTINRPAPQRPPTPDAETAVATTPPPPPPPSDTIVKSSSEPNRLPLYIGGGLLAIALVVGGILFSQRGNDDILPTSTAPIAAVLEEETAIVPSTPTAEPDDQPDEATAVVPTNTPAPEPTATATETAVPPTPTPSPLIEANRFGTLRPLTDDSRQLAGYLLAVDRVPLPPAGFEYGLWLTDEAGEAVRIGTVDVEDQQLRQAGELPAPLLSRVTGAQLTLDEIGEVSQPGEVQFAGSIDGEALPILRALLVTRPEGTPMLVGAAEQAAIAFQHATFLQDALLANDLTEAKTHAEHVLNILDGETGELFGDVDLNGQTQNPGDGVGTRVYLQETQRGLETLRAVQNTQELHFYQDQALTAVSIAQQQTQTATDIAFSVQATDTADEAFSFADELIVELDALLATLADTSEKTAVLAQFPLIGVAEQLPPPPPPLANPERGQVGQFNLFTQNVIADSYQLQVSQLSPLPADSVYAVWLENSTEGSVRLLDNLPLVQGQGELVGQVPTSLLGRFDRLLITIEPAGEALELPTGTAVYTADLRNGAREVLQALLTGNGALLANEQQLRTAIQHHGFAQDSLNAGDLDGAKVHIEHVINILVGESGDLFGDLNGDGQAQNPGDGVGVRVYWQQAAEQIAALSEAPPFAQQQYAQLDAAYQQTLAVTLDQALKVFASDTAEEAQPFVSEVGLLLDQLLRGTDSDGNGVIDPLRGEGGILTAQTAVLQLTQVPVLATEPGSGEGQVRSRMIARLAPPVQFNAAPTSLVCDLTNYAGD